MPFSRSPCALFWWVSPSVFLLLLVHAIQANGIRRYQLVCVDCGHLCGGAIAVAKLPANIRDQAPLVSNSIDAKKRCARCDSNANGVELHHWAPFGVFDDLDQWPTAWLCPRCHLRWHQAMKGYRWNPPSGAEGMSVAPDSQRGGTRQDAHRRHCILVREGEGLESEARRFYRPRPQCLGRRVDAVGPNSGGRRIPQVGETIADAQAIEKLARRDQGASRRRSVPDDDR
jgi:hypothetical protein